MESSLEMVNLLLSAGANVNHESHNGVTALMVAVAASSAEIVRALLHAGADVNTVDKVEDVRRNWNDFFNLFV